MATRYESVHSGENIDRAVALALENLPVTIKSFSVMLPSSGWSGNTQTVSISEITGTENLVVSPDADSFEAYGAALVRCTGSAYGELTFTCKTVPASDLVVNVLRLEGAV